MIKFIAPKCFNIFDTPTIFSSTIFYCLKGLLYIMIIMIIYEFAKNLTLCKKKKNDMTELKKNIYCL